MEFRPLANNGKKGQTFNRGKTCGMGKNVTGKFPGPKKGSEKVNFRCVTLGRI